MNEDTRFALIQLLGEAMGDVSEDAYAASWLAGTEFIVPELCRRALETGQPQQWGHGEIDLGRARGLSYLADQTGGWANLDTDYVGYVLHDPFPIPQRYARELDGLTVQTA